MTPATISALGQLDRWSRGAIPVIVTLLLLLTQLLPWGYSVSSMMPSLAFMSVFFWSLRQPALFPPLAALLTGAAADLSELTAIGSQALAFLMVSLTIRRRKRLASESFLRLWAAFATAVIGVAVVTWLTEALFGGHLVPPGQVLAKGAVAMAVFPLVAKFVLIPAERLAREGARD